MIGVGLGSYAHGCSRQGSAVNLTSRAHTGDRHADRPERASGLSVKMHILLLGTDASKGSLSPCSKPATIASPVNIADHQPVGNKTQKET